MKLIRANIQAHHRWKDIEDKLIPVLSDYDNTQITATQADIVFVSFVEMFIYKQEKPILKPWVGIIHDPPQTKHYVKGRCIFKNKHFINSLENCRHLFTMSTETRDWVRSKLDRRDCTHIGVSQLLHPLPDISVSNYGFNYQAYKNSNRHKIYQIGSWLRKSYSIFLLKLPETRYKKYILPYTKNNRFRLTKNLTRDHITLNSKQRHSVNKIKVHLSDDVYTQIFTTGIIFLDLYASTVNNVFLEAIRLNTPVLINQLPSVVEYLGQDYPFYFSSYAEAENKAQDIDLIGKTHIYLTKMDKSSLSFDYFANCIMSEIAKL